MSDVQPYLDVGMLTCFWCGEDMGVTIDRRIKRGRPPIGAPKHYIANYEPCDKCKEIFNKGIHIIGVTDTPIMDKQPSIVVDNGVPMYPNGTWFMANEEWVTHFLADADDQEVLDNVLKSKKLLVPYEIVQKVLSGIKQEEAQANESDSSGSEGNPPGLPDKED